ncbi:hypothetical protein Godav_016463 [Gossypium davidsonii]|uniref:Uncharacterized protein n=2 Tax=Gossypium TaxID=3633 RepID=A0A7J8RSU4_GOSDV|nr:hypothetical protein [Gossypium davidsonii]
MLDRMGNGMDATRGIMSGTMDRFKKVFEKKSNRKMCTLVMAFVDASICPWLKKPQHSWKFGPYTRTECLSKAPKKSHFFS